MTTKLTLRLDDTVIRKAKKTARTTGVSLSRMVEDYFKSVGELEQHEVRVSPVLYEVSGVLSGKYDDTQLRAGYRKYLAEKYR
jgi:vacuolar-type H+-ATPase catalytic subunit A/Vma1